MAEVIIIIMLTILATNILEFEDSHSITEGDGEVTVVAVADSTQLTEAEYNVSPELNQAQPGSGEGELSRQEFDVQDMPPVLEGDTVTPPEAGLLA